MRPVFLSVVALLTISLAAAAQVPLQFVAVTPCRVADTRWQPDGPFSGPPIQGQASPRNFTIPDGACSIPNTAAAYSLNVSVVPHEGLGYLTVWPAGQTRPVLATLDSIDGRIKANAAIIPAGTNEAISVYASQTTEVVLDINGYFAAVGSCDTGLLPADSLPGGGYALDRRVFRRALPDGNGWSGFSRCSLVAAPSPTRRRRTR